MTCLYFIVNIFYHSVSYIFILFHMGFHRVNIFSFVRSNLSFFSFMIHDHGIKFKDSWPSPRSQRFPTFLKSFICYDFDYFI